MRIKPWQLLLSLASLFIALPTCAQMQPRTSMVLINEEAGGGSINVTNTDNKDALLYVKVYDLPDDKGPQVLVTQPVMRVGAGQTQRVRFILTTDAPLKTEHMKRVTFEGLPLATSSSTNGVELNVRQNLPIIIHPKGLAANPDPWKSLQWSVSSKGQLTIHNSSAWVVRMAPGITLLPGNQTATIDKSYILPGEKLPVNFSDTQALAKTDKVRIETLSQYGFEVGKVELPVSHGN